MKKRIAIQLVALGDDGFHIFCKVKVNGKKVRALIDTGASKSVLSKHYAAQMNNLKEVQVSDAQTSGIGPEKVEAEFAVIKKLSFGKLNVKKLVVGLIDLSHVEAVYEQFNIKPFDMIIGGDVLLLLKAKIDYRKKKLILTK